MLVSCEHVNKPLGSNRCMKFLDYLRTLLVGTSSEVQGGADGALPSLWYFDVI